MLDLGILAAFATLILYGSIDTLLKLPSAKIGKAITLALFFSINLIPILAFLPFLHAVRLSNPVYVASIVYGLLFFLGWFYMTKSLETEQVSNASAFVGLEYAIIVIFGAFGLSEAVAPLQWIGIISAFVGVFFVALNGNFRINLKLLPAIVGCVFFGFSGVSLAYAINASGNFITPILIGRVSGLVLILVYLFTYYKKGQRNGTSTRSIDRRALGVAAIAGTLEGLAVLLWGFFVSLDKVALGNAIVGMEPALVVLFGYLFFKDRFAKHNILGFVLIVCGILVLVLA